jgi:diaminopimelate decarboxylase
VKIVKQTVINKEIGETSTMPMSKDFEKRLLAILPQVINKYGTPFHIYDEQGICEGLRRLNGAFASRKLPFKEFYAVKALPKPAIMEIIKNEGCGFDCSSIPELRLARNAGAKPGDIMFTSNNTSTEEFSEALALGGCILNLDGIEYVEKVKSFGPFPKLVCFRLNPGDRKTDDEVNSIIGKPKESKYGVPIEDIVTAYRLAKEAGAESFGLHTMVCSNDRNYKHMVATFKLLLEVAAQLENELGIVLEFANVGGGVGVAYRPEEDEFDIEAFAEGCSVLGNEFEAKHGYVPRIFMESGRWVTGPHGVLVNRVINTYNKYQRFVGVEAAMPALMRPGMYGAYHHHTLLDSNGLPIAEGSRPMVRVTVAGSICENCDVLARDIWLPEPRVGDLIVTHTTGAHGTAMCFNYNGRTRIQELLNYMSRNVRRICRAETFDDLEVRHRGLEGAEHVLHVGT